MHICSLGKGDIRVLKAVGRAGIEDAVQQVLQLGPLPSLQSRIFIKPNLNNDLSALTGNSTDLRLLAAVVELLQRWGCADIVVGDGPNIGTYRKGIDVLERLGVRVLCAHYGVECIDLNHAPAIEISLTTGPVRVAKLCLEADFFINLPKLKTHAEAGMSLALKSLIGCVVGTDKRLVHHDLAANIVVLNEAIRPDLFIADALVAMEGNGPGDGVPCRTDTLVAGTDAFALDLTTARLFGLNPDSIPYLRVAVRRGHLEQADFAVAGLEPLLRLGPPASRGRLTRLLDSRTLANLRDLTRFIHGQEWARRLLYRLHILQDVYEAPDARIERLWLDADRCTRCGLCLDYCPLRLPIIDRGFAFDSELCRRCLYCFQVCPEQAIQVEGELGYLRRHFARYSDQIREAVGEA
jgi:uncharacterized protein (DUF362 family)/Pyruvate/2-oxoacid:ferredoxin oxidoreductase delta subunit